MLFGRECGCVFGEVFCVGFVGVGGCFFVWGSCWGVLYWG